jgi:hypothetical protein
MRGVSRIRTPIWVSVALLGAVTAAAVTITIVGVGAGGTTAALRVTGRLSLIVFWPAYAGGFFSRAEMPFLTFLARRRREFGLSFAVAHFVHVLLILWLFQQSAQSPVSVKTIVLDGTGIAWVYVLAAFSADRLRHSLSPMMWRLLFNIGLEYIALVFLKDFLVFPLREGHASAAAYLPFTILLLAGGALRWTTAGYSVIERMIALQRSSSNKSSNAV